MSRDEFHRGGGRAATRKARGAFFTPATLCRYVRLYLLLVDANPFNPAVEAYHVSDPSKPVALNDMMGEAIELVAERNFDLYEEDKAGNIRKV